MYWKQSQNPFYFSLLCWLFYLLSISPPLGTHCPKDEGSSPITRPSSLVPYLWSILDPRSRTQYRRAGNSLRCSFWVGSHLSWFGHPLPLLEKFGPHLPVRLAHPLVGFNRILLINVLVTVGPAGIGGDALLNSTRKTKQLDILHISFCLSKFLILCNSQPS